LNPWFVGLSVPAIPLFPAVFEVFATLPKPRELGKLSNSDEPKAGLPRINYWSSAIVAGIRRGAWGKRLSPYNHRFRAETMTFLLRTRPAIAVRWPGDTVAGRY